MKRVLVLLAALTLTACGGASAPDPDPAFTPRVTYFEPVPPAPTQMPAPAVMKATRTVEAQATATLSPTPSTRPATPNAKQTPVPSPKPTFPVHTVFNGRGNTVVQLSKRPGLAVVQISVDGNKDFTLANYNAEGRRLNNLVSHREPYHGMIMIDQYKGEETAQFRVESSGNWQIEVIDVSILPAAIVPGDWVGDSDDVIWLKDTGATLMSVSMPTSGIFDVKALYRVDFDLSVESVLYKFAPYSGVFPLPKNIYMLQIHATAPWKISFSK